MFNLLTNPWLPIVRQDGTKSVIAPRGITEDISANPVIAVDWPRSCPTVWCRSGVLSSVGCIVRLPVLAS